MAGAAPAINGWRDAVREGRVAGRMSSLVYALFKTRDTLAPVFLRMALVAIFFFHGAQKAFGWFGGDGYLATLQLMTKSAGLGLPNVLATTAIVGELLVSVLLFFGLLTRLASLLAAALICGAIWLVHSGAAFTQLEFPLLVLASTISLFFSGGGYFSLDRRIGTLILPPYRGQYLR